MTVADGEQSPSSSSSPHSDASCDGECLAVGHESLEQHDQHLAVFLVRRDEGSCGWLMSEQRAAGQGRKKKREGIGSRHGLTCLKTAACIQNQAAARSKLNCIIKELISVLTMETVSQANSQETSPCLLVRSLFDESCECSPRLIGAGRGAVAVCGARSQRLQRSERGDSDVGHWEVTMRCAESRCRQCARLVRDGRAQDTRICA